MRSEESDRGGTARTVHPGTVAALLLSIAAALWSVAFYLERDVDSLVTDVEDNENGDTIRPDRLTAHSPPPRRGDGLCGRVIDPRGKPLEGARVVLGSRECRTDRSGRFELPRSSEPLVVSREGYFPLHLSPSRLLEDPFARDPVTLVLFPGVTLKGRVRDGAGPPLAGARVFISRDLHAGSEEVLTASDGSWRSPLLHPGPVHLLVRHHGFQSADRLLFQAQAGEEQISDFVLVRGDPLTVNVTDARGQPLPDAQVWLDSAASIKRETNTPGPRVHESRYLGRTGDLGSLSDGRPPGEPAAVRVRLAGYREASREVGIHDRTVSLALRTAPLLEVQAIEDRTGLPVTPVTVTLEFLSSGEFLAVPHRGLLFHSLSAGKIRVGLPPVPGTYRLVVEAEDRLFGTSAEVAFDGLHSPPRSLVRLETRLQLTGVVRHRGRPVAGARVEVLTEEQGARGGLLYGVRVPPYPPRLITTTTDDRGRFSFAGLPAGTYRLAARYEGLADYLSPPIRFPGNVPFGEYPIALCRGGRLEGRVESIRAPEVSPASPTGHADVPLVLVSSVSRPRVTWTDAEGRFQFEDLPPASDYELRLGSPAAPSEDRAGAGIGKETSVAPAVSGPIILDEGAEVSQNVPAPPPAFGSAFGRVGVDGEARATELWFSGADGGGGRTVITEDDGTFLVRGLRPGRYRVVSRALAVDRELVVRPGRRQRLDIDVKLLRYEVGVRSLSTHLALDVPWRLELSPKGASRETAHRRLVTDASTTLVGLVPGRYTLRLEARGYVTREETIDLHQDRSDTFVLEPGNEVRIRLHTEEGDVYRGEVDVEIRRGDRLLHHASYQVEGEVVLPALGRGEYTLILRAADRTTRSRLRIGMESSPAEERSAVPEPPGTSLNTR